MKAEVTKSYMITNVPLAVWMRLRARALREGITVKALFLKWIAAYAENK